MKYLDFEKLELDVEEKKVPSWSTFDEKHNQPRILHYRKSSPENTCVFSAPPGVNPFHVTATEVRKFTTGGSKLIFIWPQKASNRGRMPSIMIPIIRTLLVGLMALDTLHLWPGEFLPTRIPSTLPPLPPPVKCNVIEPRWSDTS